MKFYAPVHSYESGIALSARVIRERLVQYLDAISVTVVSMRGLEGVPRRSRSDLQNESFGRKISHQDMNGRVHNGLHSLSPEL